MNHEHSRTHKQSIGACRRESANSPTSTTLEDIVGGFFKFELWAGSDGRRQAPLPAHRSRPALELGHTHGVYACGRDRRPGSFNQDIHQYLPYLASGMIVWTLVSTLILESCTSSRDRPRPISQRPFRILVMPMHWSWRNLILFSHNLVVILVLRSS